MPVALDAWEIAVRLLCSTVAAALIGLERGEHGNNAGLRTNVLVCLSATMSMVLANALLHTTGKAPDSFVNFDVMRLPLGILTGIGFIGAGAIVRRGELVLGVTTAATLWFVTMMGFCFGSGQLGLGAAMFGLGILVLQGFKLIERRIETRRFATVEIVLRGAGLTDEEIRRRFAGYSISRWTERFQGEVRSLRFRVGWFENPGEIYPPAFLRELHDVPGVESLSWHPRE
jgi:putative Mg2+ transporter-C (MgtC) family protein